MAIFARSEQRRYAKNGIVPPKKSAFTRRVIEPLLNLVGMLLTALGSLLGASRVMGYHDKLMGGLAGKASGPFDPRLPQLEETRKLMDHVEQLAGTHPAVLCLMSHPPVLPESLGLNVEMARQGLLALHSLRPLKGHARILLAVDAYALDMLGPYEEGLYAGFMGTYHLGLDRLAQHRLAPSRWLLDKASWWRLPWRTSRYLSSGQSLAMVLSGGVPVTARVLYAAREFLWKLRRRRTISQPAEILERLEGESAEFARFRREEATGAALRRSAWRLIDAWIVARMSGLWPVDDDSIDRLAHGGVSEEQIGCLRACAIAMGYPSERIQPLLDDFREEFARETPYRERFFRFLIHRVLSRGRPIVLLPMAHQLEGSSMKLSWSSPIALLKYSHETLHICRGPVSPDEVVPLDRFAREFVRVHYT